MSQRALLLSISVSSVIAFVLEDHQYCTVRYKRLCQGKGRHVACEYLEDGPGESCQNYTSIKFTDDLKHFITHYINRRRQRIAAGTERVRGGLLLPKPEIMMLVEWDRELAFLAQRLADQCHFVHDDCRATVRYPYAGQTVGEVRWRRSSDSDELSAQRAIRRVFDAWWGERRRVTPKHLTTPFSLNTRGGVYGHFTQLTVWTLRAVGCAAVRHGADYPRLLLVCDFSHTNMLGQRTLVPGPLKPCPIHTVRRLRSPYPLLCGPVHRQLSKTDDELTDVQYDYDNVNGPNKHLDDGEGEMNEDNTVEIGDVSTSRVLVQASREKIKAPIDVDERKYFRFKNDDFKLQENNIKKVQRKEFIMENLEKELQRKKSVDQTRGYGIVAVRKSLTKRPFTGRWSGYRNGEETKITNLRKTVSSDSRVISFYEPISRPRWKQQRERPRRPGANALLNLVTKEIDVHIRKTSQAPFTLDKEDIEQLFKDTGFSLSWKKNQ